MYLLYNLVKMVGDYLPICEQVCMLAVYYDLNPEVWFSLLEQHFPYVYRRIIRKARGKDLLVILTQHVVNSTTKNAHITAILVMCGLYQEDESICQYLGDRSSALYLHLTQRCSPTLLKGISEQYYSHALSYYVSMQGGMSSCLYLQLITSIFIPDIGHEVAYTEMMTYLEQWDYVYTAEELNVHDPFDVLHTTPFFRLARANPRLALKYVHTPGLFLGERSFRRTVFCSICDLLYSSAYTNHYNKETMIGQHVLKDCAELMRTSVYLHPELKPELDYAVRRPSIPYRIGNDLQKHVYYH